jgi:hypothetical protein
MRVKGQVAVPPLEQVMPALQADPIGAAPFGGEGGFGGLVGWPPGGRLFQVEPVPLPAGMALAGSGRRGCLAVEHPVLGSAGHTDQVTMLPHPAQELHPVVGTVGDVDA